MITQSYIKKLANCNAAYVYMFAVDNALLAHFFSLGYLRDLDFTLRSFYDESTVCIVLDTEQESLVSELHTWLSHFKLTTETFQDSEQRVKAAGGELSLRKDQQLAQTIRKINATQWISWDELSFTVTAASPEIGSGQVVSYTKDEYEERGLLIWIRDCPDELRPLAITVIGGLQVIFWQALCLQLKTAAVIDDDWLKNSESIGQVVAIRDTANNLDLILKSDLIDGVRSEILEKGFAQKIVASISENLDEPRKFFWEDDLAWYSGVIMGRRGWEKVATEENVLKIMGMLTIEVTPRQND